MVFLVTPALILCLMSRKLCRTKLLVHISDLFTGHARANFVHLIGFPRRRCISRGPWTPPLQVSGRMDSFNHIEVIKITNLDKKSHLDLDQVGPGGLGGVVTVTSGTSPLSARFLSFRFIIAYIPCPSNKQFLRCHYGTFFLTCPPPRQPVEVGIVL